MTTELIETGVEGVRAAHMTRRRASNGSMDAMTVVWDTQTITCCETQGSWSADDPPIVWDSTGMGAWQTGQRGQCGGCGKLVCCRCELLEGDWTDEEVREQARALAAALAEEAAAYRRHLLAELAALAAETAEGLRDGSIDLAELPHVSSMTRGGVGVDSDDEDEAVGITAWAWLDDEDTIEASVTMARSEIASERAVEDMWELLGRDDWREWVPESAHEPWAVMLAERSEEAADAALEAASAVGGDNGPADAAVDVARAVRGVIRARSGRIIDSPAVYAEHVFDALREIGVLALDEEEA